MAVQYIIVGIVLTLAILYFVRYLYTEYKENVRYKRYGCAGCALYDKCSRSKKKTV